MRKKTYLKNLGVSALSLLLGASLLPMANFADMVKAVENTSIESPILGNTITWDCIYFGNYPQSEITETTDTNTYKMLQSSNDWNTNQTLTINDVTYKRIKKDDATSTGASYHWTNDNTYHYFKFEPIKWRVIEVNGTSAYMISDVALDTQKYNLEAKDVSWNNSTLRSWLNGYATSKNQAAVDYRFNNFVSTAFNSKEMDIIVSTNNDKVTILSEQDLKNNTAYGLHTQENRTCKASTYAEAMGAYEDILGTCNYWTSTNGNSNLTAKFTQQSGEVYTKGYSVVYARNAVRATITINLEKTDCYRYAGTVSSDGTVTDPVVTSTPTTTATVTPVTTPTITTMEPTFTASPFAPTTVIPTTTGATPTEPIVPTKTEDVTTTAPHNETVAPTTVSTVSPTKPVSTAVPTKEASTTTPTATPSQTATPVKTNIKKGSVYSHTSSNGKYRVTKINKTTAKDGTIGTVAFIKPIKKTKTTSTIPNTVTIKKCKFKVTVIDKNAFANNKKLKKVVIGKNITKINANAFKGCKKLSKITIRATGLTKKSIEKNAFKNIHAKATIQIPSKKASSYKKWLKAAGVGKSAIFKKLK